MAMRLKVIKNAPTLHERVGKRLMALTPGTVFDHPDDKRAKRLLAIRPAIVEATTEPTAKELHLASERQAAKAKEAQAKALKEANEAHKAQAVIEGALGKLGDALGKMKEADVLAEATKRKLADKLPADAKKEAVITAILADERAKLEKA